MGYTPYYTAAVWTGYEQNEKMKTGSANPAAVLWKKVMSQVHEGLENKKFPEVSGLKQVTYCLDSGLLAGEYCALSPRAAGWLPHYIFPEDYPDGRTCTVHTAESVVKVCVDSPILNEDGTETGLYHIAGPYCPEESLREVCYPNYEREKVGSAVAQDEMYRFDVVEAQGTCTVHTEAPVVQPDPSDPNFPWDPSQPWTPMIRGLGARLTPVDQGADRVPTVLRPPRISPKTSGHESERLQTPRRDTRRRLSVWTLSKMTEMAENSRGNFSVSP